MVFNSVNITDFNTTLSLGYSGAGTLPASNNNAQSDDGGTTYTYYNDQPFVVAVNGNIIPTVITWDGSFDNNWNTAANWDLNTVPTEYDLVAIPVVASGSFSPEVNEAPATPAACNDLTINAGALLSINPGKALTVNGTLTNNEGVAGLTINSDAANGSGSLIHHTANVPAYLSTTVTGSATLTDYKYHLVSVPLTPAGNALSGLFQDCYLYDFDVANNAWNGLGTSTITALDETKGYMIYYPGASANYSFDGNMNAGAFAPTVVNAGSGYNLVPNPYPSSIDWDAASGWTKTNIDNATWIWNSNASTAYGSGIVGNYAAWVNGVGTNDGSRYIAPGQAFFVKSNAASPALGMTDDVRLHHATQFLKSGESIPDLLRIGVTANDHSDEAVVRFTDEATVGLDMAFDAPKMFGLDDAPQIYTMTADNNQLSINSLPHSASTVTVPLNFELKTDKPATLTLSGMESFNPNTNIYLEDKLAGTTINLRQQHTYAFAHQQGNDAGRFLLHFSGIAGMEDPAKTSGRVWISDHTVNIAMPASAGENASVEIFSMSGQRVFSQQVKLSDLTKVPVNLSGIFIIRITAAKELMVTKGIF